MGIDKKKTLIEPNTWAMKTKNYRNVSLRRTESDAWKAEGYEK